MYYYLIRYRIETRNKDYLIFSSLNRDFQKIEPKILTNNTTVSLESPQKIEAKLQELESTVKQCTLSSFQEDEYLKKIKITSAELDFIIEGVDYLGTT